MANRKSFFTLLLFNAFVLLAAAQSGKVTGSDSTRDKKITAADSLTQKRSNKTKSFLSSKGRGVAGKIKSDVSNGLEKDIAKSASQLSPVLSKVKLLTEAKPILIDKLDFNGAYSYMGDTSLIPANQAHPLQSVYGYGLDAGVSVFSIPFSFSLVGNNSGYAISHSPLDNFYKINYDHKKYLEILQKQVLEKIKPEQVLSSITKRLNELKAQYESQLKQEITKIKEDFKKQYLGNINLPDNISDLAVTDLAALKNKVFETFPSNEHIQQLQRYDELLKNGNVKDSLVIKEALSSIKKHEALEKIYSRIISFKQKFEENQLVKELKSHLPFTPDKFQHYLRNPANLKKVIMEQAELGNLQKLFMNITHLDIGQNPIQGGELNLKDVMNNGLNLGYATKKINLGFVYGKSNNANNWLQSGLQNFVTNEYSSLTGLTVGTAEGKQLQQSVTVNLFNFKQDPQQDINLLRQTEYLPMAQRQDAVITWQSQYQLTSKDQVSLDVSKSFGSYTNTYTDTLSNSKNYAIRSLLGGEGKSNYAVSLNYQGEIVQTPVEFTYKNVGLGYSNPGNMFLRRGESQYSLGISRKLLKQKLSFRYRVDYRNQKFDPSSNYQYQSFSNKFQLNYRVKRNNSVGLTYNNTGYHSKMYRQTTGAGINSRLQLDANYRMHVKGKKLINHFSLSNQTIDLPIRNSGNYKSHNILLTQTSSLMLAENLLTFSLVMNKSNNKDYYFNTSFFNAESGYSYVLMNTIHLTNKVGYYVNKGWNKQLGVQQQVSASIFKKLDADLDLSYKKSIQVTRQEMANQLFISTSLHYQFN